MTIAYSYSPTLGGVPLTDVVELSATYGRELAEYRPARGDGAEMFDLGKSARKYTIQARLGGTDEEIRDKRQALVAFANDGQERVYQHPLDGPVNVRLDNIDIGDADTATSVTMNLAETVPFSSTTVERVDASTLSNVETSVVALDIALAAVPLLAAPPNTAAALGRAEGWTDETPPRDLATDLEEVQAAFADVETELSSLTDVDAYRATLASVGTRGELARYATTVASRAVGYGSVTLRQPASLMAFLTERTGASRANQIYTDVIARNSIRDPRVVRAGQVLEIPLDS